jgi:hypothetical protein
MAEEPIRKDDIIDLSGTQESVNELIKVLENLATVMRKDVKGAADELVKSLQGVNVATKEGQEIVKNAATASENLAAQDKEMSKIDKEVIQLKTRLTALNTNEANEVAKLKVAIEGKNKAMKDSARLDDSAEGSVNKMRARLKELTAEYNKLGGAARKEAAPAVNKLTEELKKAEEAIGNNTRRVGGYTKSIIAAATKMVSFTALIALASKAFNALKESFFASDQGIGLLAKWTEASKTYIYQLLHWRKMEGGELQLAISASAELNKLRTEERTEMVKVAKIQNEIKLLRLDAASAKEADQLKLLTLADKKEDEVITIETEHLVAEIRAYEQLWLTRKDDASLMDIIAQKRVELEGLTGEKNLRIATRLAVIKGNIEKKGLADGKDANEAYGNWVIAHEEYLEAEKERIWDEGTVAAQLAFDQNKKLAEEEWKLHEELNKKKEEDDKKYEDLKKQRLGESLTRIGDSLNTLSSLYEANKQKELSAAGDNAEARLEIEKKYAKKQQLLGIGQALINGALAVTEIWAKWAKFPVLAAVFTALTVAQTAAQVAIIKAQKFAKGGAGVLNGPVHTSGGIQIPGIGEAEGGEHFAITSRAMTSKYGSKTLDAISNSINQGKFFEVWSNVNKSMGTSDPYTKKMYELMQNTPTVYTDTQGDTVKEYPNGQKYIIKRMKIWKN